MRIGSRVMLAALTIALLATWAFGQHAGTWKLNPAKSTYTTDHPAPKNLTLTIKEEGNGIVIDGVGEAADGSPINLHISSKFDGADTAATGLPADANTVSVTRADANTLDVTNKKDGVVMYTVHSVVSPDGKTRTSTFSGKDSKGNPETWVSVYDKM